VSGTAQTLDRRGGTLSLVADLNLMFTLIRRPLLIGAALAGLLTPPAAIAQDVTASALKAAFIYNFVKFTEWPLAAPASEPFLICVIGDAAVGDALERVVDGREFAGRRIAVSAAASARPTAACNVLYVSGATTSEAVRVIQGLQDGPVLTISDVVGFTDTGGIAQFFFERSQLRFSINVNAVRRSGLKISSKLLTMGKR
jgi:hypothetical protein